MKKAIILAALVAMLAVPAFAQWRVDIGGDIPFYVGIANTAVGESLGESIPYFIPFPNAALSYQFDLGLVSLGLGAKMYSFIVVNVLFPMAYVEMDFDPLVVNLSAWGGAFLVFGLVQDTFSENIIVPDLSVMFKAGRKKTLRLGGGIMTGIDLGGSMENFPFIAYGAIKFSFPL
ncbi:MAG: hypothetical protein GX430_03015 [Treponema sp.]|nr:hypothetical protein [Treponema sp.]